MWVCTSCAIVPSLCAGGRLRRNNRFCLYTSERSGFDNSLVLSAPLGPNAFAQKRGVDWLDEEVIGKCCARTELCGSSIDRQSDAASDTSGRLLTLRNQIC